MPIYEYQCTKCGEVFDALQKFSDAPLTKCKFCDGKVKKLFSTPALVFKGSGFYVTDNRSGKPSTLEPSKAKPKTEHKQPAAADKKETKKTDKKS